MKRFQDPANDEEVLTRYMIPFEVLEEIIQLIRLNILQTAVLLVARTTMACKEAIHPTVMATESCQLVETGLHTSKSRILITGYSFFGV